MNDPVNQNSSVKYCGRCGNFQLIALFAKNKIKKDGLQERCTPCRKEHIKKVKHLRKPQTKEQQRKGKRKRKKKK